MTVNLDTNINTGAWADGETITSIERVFGSDGFGDSITGSDDYDKLYGLSGDDTMDGGDGRDFVGGGEGTDNLSGGADNDILLGDAGADTLSGGEGADQLTGAAGDDSLDGGAGNDRITSGLGADTIEGGDGIDTLILNEASAILDINFVNVTADAIVFANVKRVYATAHDDTITGGLSYDRMYSLGGNDVMNGGSGGGCNDLFAFEDGSGDDIITDYVQREDWIMLGEISAIASFEDLSIDGAVITAGSETITLTGFTGTLTSDDFII